MKIFFPTLKSYTEELGKKKIPHLGSIQYISLTKLQEKIYGPFLMVIYMDQRKLQMEERNTN